MTSIIMNGITYNIEIIAISISGSFLNKYVEQSIDGTIKTEAIGYKENQSITFLANNNSDFLSFYEALTTPIEGNFIKEIELYSPLGKYNFDMLPSDFDIEMNRLKKSGNSWWGECTISFTAINKVR